MDAGSFRGRLLWKCLWKCYGSANGSFHGCFKGSALTCIGFHQRLSISWCFYNVDLLPSTSTSFPKFEYTTTSGEIEECVRRSSVCFLGIIRRWWKLPWKSLMDVYSKVSTGTSAHFTGNLFHGDDLSFHRNTSGILTLPWKLPLLVIQADSSCHGRSL